MFLGVPFNIASYALLTHMVAAAGRAWRSGDFVWTGGDCHVYDNHVEQVREQLSREPFAVPDAASCARRRRCSTTTSSDFTVVDYQPPPGDPGAPVAV